MRTDTATIAELGQFDACLDVRSPAEFAEDRIPGAVNLPVLDDAERARVGTIYKQASPFLARKLGAALVARNIAGHLEEELLGHDRHWRPLVYCWRGGKRSGAMTIVLREIGWDAHQLAGGYKSFRTHVIAQLDLLPVRLDLRVICGLTGCGKSRLVAALAAQGGQVLDLETIAAHRGSVLGGLPFDRQPTQRMFETRLWEALRDLDPRRPVYVEAESRKIGVLRVPESIMAHMWSSPCVRLESDRATRVALLMSEYAHFLTDRALLAGRLATLSVLYGRRRIADWLQLIEDGRFEELVADLLERHYDPAYTRSIAQRFPDLGSAALFTVPIGGSAAAYAAIASQLLALEQVPA
ncbi:MAG: tRNA 2-selenouridine(34) synthase MnmH [Betaproteobacteria bacterium]